jgi:hypothetical protein
MRSPPLQRAHPPPSRVVTQARRQLQQCAPVATLTAAVYSLPPVSVYCLHTVACVPTSEGHDGAALAVQASAEADDGGSHRKRRRTRASARAGESHGPASARKAVYAGSHGSSSAREGFTVASQGVPCQMLPPVHPAAMPLCAGMVYMPHALPARRPNSGVGTLPPFASQPPPQLT